MGLSDATADILMRLGQERLVMQTQRGDESEGHIAGSHGLGTMGLRMTAGRGKGGKW